jgi:hypothetical protein
MSHRQEVVGSKPDYGWKVSIAICYIDKKGTIFFETLSLLLVKVRHYSQITFNYAFIIFTRHKREKYV